MYLVQGAAAISGNVSHHNSHEMKSIHQLIFLSHVSFHSFTQSAKKQRKRKMKLILICLLSIFKIVIYLIFILILLTMALLVVYDDKMCIVLNECINYLLRRW